MPMARAFPRNMSMQESFYQILDYSERLLGFEMIVQWFLEKYLIGYCCYETFAELQIQFLFPPWMFKWGERLKRQLKSAKL